MPYDPTLPVNDTVIDADELREQFHGLKGLIDAVPAGPAGPQGPAFASAVVDGVTTLDPGENATVTTSFDGSAVHFTFALPRGAAGLDGAPGDVTAAQLAAAVAGSSANTNAVATLDTPDPSPEELRLKLNELILAQRR